MLDIIGKSIIILLQSIIINMLNFTLGFIFGVNAGIILLSIFVAGKNAK